MRALPLLLFTITILASCWEENPGKNQSAQKVWGNKPIYGSTNDAKQITYIDSALPVLFPGNIYAKGNRIYQLEIGRGIHVIDNSVPSNAHRIGFITVNGSSQISIKDNNLFTNSYDDLVVLDISTTNAVSLLKRISGAFPEGKKNYFLSEPVETGYYECTREDSVVIGWRKDSIMSSCYKY